MRRKRKADDDDVFWQDPDEFRIESVGCVQQLTDEPISILEIPEREFPPGFAIPQPKETASAPVSDTARRPGARRVRRKKPTA